MTNAFTTSNLMKFLIENTQSCPYSTVRTDKSTHVLNESNNRNVGLSTESYLPFHVSHWHRLQRNLPQIINTKSNDKYSVFNNDTVIKFIHYDLFESFLFWVIYMY